MSSSNVKFIWTLQHHFEALEYKSESFMGLFKFRNGGRVEKYFTSELKERVKYLSTLEEKFRISAKVSNIS